MIALNWDKNTVLDTMESFNAVIVVSLLLLHNVANVQNLTNLTGKIHSRMGIAKCQMLSVKHRNSNAQ